MSTAAVWDSPAVVGGFAQSPPNPRLIDYARQHQCAWWSTRVLDIGGGAGRNAVPLAAAGLDVLCVDRSRPMLAAARQRGSRVMLVEAAMDDLPVRSGTIDLIVAHGIWNLARSGAEFRRATAEAARVAAPGAALFVFTFSRHTLAHDAKPVAGEELVFTQFSGEPQVFLTRDQLVSELHAVGFEPDPELPITELNLPPPGQVRMGGAPVIYQGGFLKRED